MAKKSDTPETIYGRTVEAAHLGGYSLERALDHLERLLTGDAWRSLGYEDVNDFLRSIDLSAFNLSEKRAGLCQRIKELQPGASTRAIADLTGVNHSTVVRDLAPDANAPARDENPEENVEDANIFGAIAPPAPPPEDNPPPPPPAPRHPHSDRMHRWLTRACDETLYIDHPVEGGGLGGLPRLLAERDKWDWRAVREEILPLLDILAQTVARFKEEIEQQCDSHNKKPKPGKRSTTSTN